MLFKDKNGTWHFIAEENRLFARVWGKHYNFGTKLYIGNSFTDVFEGILAKLEELEQFFTCRENRFIQDIKNEYLNRCDDCDECYTEEQVNQILERYIQMTMEEIEQRLEWAEDRGDLDNFNYWWVQRELKKRELRKMAEGKQDA